MALKPIFVGGYRQDKATLWANDQIAEATVFTPGGNGSRIHAIALSNPDDEDVTVQFGYGGTIETVNVNIVPGATAGTDPWTIVRTDGLNWDTDNHYRPGSWITLDWTVNTAQRGEHRISARSGDTLTIENGGITPVQELGIDINVRWFDPMWTVLVPARAGYDPTIPSVSGLDLTLCPWLDLSGDRYIVATDPLMARIMSPTDGSKGNIHMTIFGGDY